MHGLQNHRMHMVRDTTILYSTVQCTVVSVPATLTVCLLCVVCALGLEKLVSEEIGMHFAADFQTLQFRCARFHNIYGPQGTWCGGREKAPAAFCRKVLAAARSADHVVEMWGDGQQTRSFCLVDDCVEGILRIMRSSYTQPLNLGSDEMVSMNAMHQMAVEFENAPCTLKHISGPEGVRGRNSDNTVIKQVLGWAPDTKLVDGLRKTYYWIKGEMEREIRSGVSVEQYSKSAVMKQSTNTLDALGQVIHNHKNTGIAG